MTSKGEDSNLKGAKIRKEDVNKVVMDFLVTHGYLQAAQKFQSESETKPEVDLASESIIDRVAVTNAVQCGNVVDAIEKLNALNPEILRENPELDFRLQDQTFIELIRHGKLQEAIEFGKEMAKPIKDNRRMRDKDAYTGRFKEKLDISNRFKLASQVNAVILTSQNLEKDPKLESLLKMKVWFQEELNETRFVPA
ncbi:unnamed protein product [Microthlaspi erraticum]|uniref:CTLH domain-containing protein n=1 Tax=Microthlaspi erraticum TaxID=1685480 RepID=A0A6D2JUA9_9BRAS|nr:unnamed protein product [Microthlaspi erraticum]